MVTHHAKYTHTNDCVYAVALCIGARSLGRTVKSVGSRPLAAGEITPYAKTPPDLPEVCTSSLVLGLVAAPRFLSVLSVDDDSAACWWDCRDSLPISPHGVLCARHRSGTLWPIAVSK